MVYVGNSYLPAQKAHARRDMRRRAMNPRATASSADISACACQGRNEASVDDILRDDAASSNT
jgi:hypothetical protein